MRKEHSDTRQQQNRMLRFAAVLAVLVLLTTSVVTGRYARFATGAEGKDSARTAAFAFDVGELKSLDLSGIKIPGDSVSFPFMVSNKAAMVSEVAEVYTFQLELRGSLPLTCSLTGDGETLTLVNDGDIATNNETNHTLRAGVEENVSYTLTVSWPQEKNDIEFSRDGAAELTVSVTAQQVD